MTSTEMKSNQTRKKDFVSFNPVKITTVKVDLPDTIEKVTIKMGGRTVDFDVNKFMDMLESFKWKDLDI